MHEVVSLRDLPATIVDLAGQGAGSPFPGHSMANLWRDSDRAAATVSTAVSELLVPNPRNCQPGSIAGLSRSADFGRRRRFCLHPQPG